MGEYTNQATPSLEESSSLALLCLNDVKTNNVQKTLELGEGHGRDAMFFATTGIDIEVLDYLSEGIDT